MSPQFIHRDLRLLNPKYDSPLIDVLQELEHLRKLRIAGTTPEPVFFQLKYIFHMVESLGSARIEGNHTTLADYIESKIHEDDPQTDQLREIANINRAMDQIDEEVEFGTRISESFIRELHFKVVSALVREGDNNPGAYRKAGVTISGSAHQPPEAIAVSSYMQELVDFINRVDPNKYDLMKVALAHHRFSWIHPFTNGNGRVVRLLTYAMLIKFGFNVGALGRVLNPTAVFCNDRNAYYNHLAAADTGDEEALSAWCHYVLSGVLTELKKLDRLAEYEYLRASILLPALTQARTRELLTQEEFLILKYIVESPKVEIKAADIGQVVPKLSSNQRTYRVRSLLQARLIQPVRENVRLYTICFLNNNLLRGVVAALIDEGFVPSPLQDSPIT